MFRKKLLQDESNVSTEMLVSQWQATKNQELLQQIINRHMALIEKIANGYRGSSLELHDLVAEGILGLIHSMEKFKISYEVKFPTYAFYWIKSKISLYAWKMKHLIQINFSNKNAFVYSVLKDIKEDKLSYEEGVKKIEEKENITDEKARKSLGLLSQKMTSLHKNLLGHREDHHLSLEDTLVNNEHEDMLEEKDMEDLMNLVEEASLSLTDQQRYILNHRWLTETPSTLQEIASKLHISTEGVRKMEIRTLNALRENITSRIYNGQNLSLSSLHLIFLLNLILEDI